MMQAIVSILFFAFLAVVTYIAFFGLDRWIAKRLRSSLAPGETVVFESRVSPTRAGWNLLRPAQQGHLLVTNERLLLGWMALPPAWMTANFLSIREIESATILRALGVNNVRIIAKDEELKLSPHKLSLHPWAGDKGKELVAALESRNYTRSQIEPRR